MAAVTEFKEKTRFGTFGGVFTPSLLTILGVIMFLRFNTVVGYAGFLNTFYILLGAKLISTITGMSIASVATNMRVKGGGAYFLISRSLGAEFGGVIAIFFFIAQAVAVSMYVIGFSEAVLWAFPGLDFSLMELGTITNVIVFACVFIGAGWTIKIQYGILAVVALSLLSFFIGAGMNFSTETLALNMEPSWTPQYGFFAVFALFFPAVTGIMAGVNMSGDLKDPSSSIPRGTFASIGTSALIYFLIALFLAASVSRTDLLSDSFVMKDISLVPVLIFAGVFAATLSSALGSMMGAPRILQSFSRDMIFGSFKLFGRGSGRNDEPRVAIVITFLIAQTGIMAGDLNTIAPLITMFFLMTYGTMNLACFYEGLSHNPSFRPTYKINHWSIALLGALGCLFVMILINFVWAAAALILASFLYYAISRKEVQVKWGDITSGLAYQRARKALLTLENEKYHPKNWRPSIIVLSGSSYNRLHLSEYGYWFTFGYGVLTIGQIIVGNFSEMVQRRQEAEKNLRKFIAKQELSAFPAVVVKDDVHTAVHALIQCYGIGGLKPNTVLMGWSRDNHKDTIFYKTADIIKKMERSLIVISCKQEQENITAVPGHINILWTGQSNGELMLLLAYLLKTNAEWGNRKIKVIKVIPPEGDAENARISVDEVICQSRIETEIVVLKSDDPILAVRNEIGSSGILFAGFEEDEENPDAPYAKLQRVADLPYEVILVHNSGDASIAV